MYQKPLLSDAATLEVNDVIHQLTTEQGFHIVAGVQHQLRNEHNENLSFIVTSTPPSHGDRVEI